MLAHVSFTPRRMVEIEKGATKTTRRRSEVTWFGEWGAVWNGGAGGRGVGRFGMRMERNKARISTATGRGGVARRD